MDIRQFLKNLSNYTRIDFQGKESEFEALSKYDKNKNSIFETDELQTIKDDLIFYARTDGNSEDLGEEEAQGFLQSLLQESQSLGDSVNNTGKTIGGYAADLLNQLQIEGEKTRRIDYIKNNVQNRDFGILDSTLQALLELEEEQFERAKTLFHVENREEQFSGFAIIELAKLNNIEFERAKTLFHVESREKQFHAHELIRLAKLNDMEFERAKTLFYVENRTEQFLPNEIIKLAMLEDKNFENAKELFYVGNRTEQLDGNEIASLAILDIENFERAKNLLHVEDMDVQFSVEDIKRLLRLNNEEFERAKTLFHVESREKQFDANEIIELSKLNNNEFENAKNFFYVENRKCQIGGIAIAKLSKLNKKDLDYAKQLLYVKDRETQFSSNEIIDLIKLNNDERKRAKQLFYIGNRVNQFSGEEIASLSRLDDEKFRRAKKWFLVRYKDKQFNAQEIIELSKLNKQEEEWFYNHLQNSPFSLSNNVKIAKNHCLEIENLLSQNKIQNVEYTASDCLKISLIGDDKLYTYDKTGLIETTEEKNISYDNFEHCRMITVDNFKLNLKHEITKGIPINTQNEVVINEKLTYYDNDSNIIKTIVVQRNPKNGTLNVSETDRNGKTIPIQWESINSEVGANITERHLISPEGVKTEFYAEESDNLKITDYQIVDKDGKPLIDIHQTFQKISENKFISSINTTGKDGDTHVYEIEYTDDYKVRIFDKKNNTTKEINLTTYFDDAFSLKKLYPIIKQLPGQILLEFLEKPFAIKHAMSMCIENAHWDSQKIQLLIGDFNSTVNAKDNIFGVLMHELGHYLDLYNNPVSNFANNKDILSIYKEEFDVFQKTTTTVQQEYLGYFTNGGGLGDTRGSQERVAEAHSIFYSTNAPQGNTRRLYLAQYFPRTMAAIMKLLLEEEGVKTN